MDTEKSFIQVWEIVLIIVLFFVFSYLTQSHIKTLRAVLGTSVLSMGIYVLIFIIAVVIAPINSEPLLPIASQAWGWMTARSLTLVGWTLGSVIAFLIARRYGLAFLQRFVSLGKIRQFEKLIPQEHVFWSIVFLRMTVQVDFLSYLLGLFTRISTKKYFLATFIGLAPFAFLLAYLGELPFSYQLLALSTGLLTLLLGIIIALERQKSLERKNKPFKSLSF